MRHYFVHRDRPTLKSISESSWSQDTFIHVLCSPWIVDLRNVKKMGHRDLWCLTFLNCNQNHKIYYHGKDIEKFLTSFRKASEGETDRGLEKEIISTKSSREVRHGTCSKKEE